MVNQLVINITTNAISAPFLYPDDLLSNYLLNPRLHKWLHDQIAFLIGMNRVITEMFPQPQIFIDHGGEVIDVDKAFFPGEGFYTLIEFNDELGWFNIGRPRKPVGGEHGTKQHADFFGTSQLCHGDDVVLNHVNSRRAGVTGDIVDTGKDHNDAGVEIDHILSESQEHLWGGLAADAAIDIRLAFEEFGAMAGPAFGDRVAHKDDALLIRLGSGEGGVGFAESVKAGPVLGYGTTGEEQECEGGDGKFHTER